MSNFTTVAQVKDAVNELTELIGDPEEAHAAEDNLVWDLVRSIAEGDLKGNAAIEACREALRAQDIEFERWCA